MNFKLEGHENIQEILNAYQEALDNGTLIGIAVVGETPDEIIFSRGPIANRFRTAAAWMEMAMRLLGFAQEDSDA